MSEGVEYHWHISYVVPGQESLHYQEVEGIYTVMSPTTTRQQVFRKIVRDVKEMKGLTDNSFVILSFTLEPNRLGITEETT